jgi:single-strand DNA-binding protein
VRDAAPRGVLRRRQPCLVPTNRREERDMNEPFVTFQGWVGDVVYRETKEGNVANLRVACTPRIRRKGEWTDGPTSWFSVACWRALAENVRQSVKKGDPVIVHGRLRADVWQRDDNQTSTTYIVEASYVGHDLSRGTSIFSRSVRPERSEADDETSNEIKSLFHESPTDLVDFDSSGNVRTGRSSAA